jgi:phage host-nuclease inhibitor protein Gam
VGEKPQGGNKTVQWRLVYPTISVRNYNNEFTMINDSLAHPLLEMEINEFEQQKGQKRSKVDNKSQGRNKTEQWRLAHPSISVRNYNNELTMMNVSPGHPLLPR